MLPYLLTSAPRLYIILTVDQDSPMPLILPLFAALTQTANIAVIACQRSYPLHISGPVIEKMRNWQRLSTIQTATSGDSTKPRGCATCKLTGRHDVWQWHINAKVFL